MLEGVEIHEATNAIKVCGVGGRQERIVATAEEKEEIFMAQPRKRSHLKSESTETSHFQTQWPT
jgi:hypothetical protein